MGEPSEMAIVRAAPTTCPQKNPYLSPWRGAGPHDAWALQAAVGGDPPQELAADVVVDSNLLVFSTAFDAGALWPAWSNVDNGLSHNGTFS